MTGKIIKGIGGFYYVKTTDFINGQSSIYECRAKGIFRKEKIKPLVGDMVDIEVISEEEKTGNVVFIHQRKNTLIRPEVANVDQAIVIFALKKPAPNFQLLDRFLLEMKIQDVPTIICFNKSDLCTEEMLEEVKEIYEHSGCEVIFSSTVNDMGLEVLKNHLRGKTSTVAGPSGVGKSSIVNALSQEGIMETGMVSEKIDRGKHTTRHSQLIMLEKDTYIMDTPGFSSLLVHDMEKEELKDYIPEFYEYEGNCRFLPCTHTHEPDCAVKEALQRNEISRVRYDNYMLMYDELKNKRRY